MITSGPPTPPVPSPFQVLLILQSLESRVYHCVQILVIQAEITINFLEFYFVQSHNDCFNTEQVAGITLKCDSPLCSNNLKRITPPSSFNPLI
jgi:hypothetical protein